MNGLTNLGWSLVMTAGNGKAFYIKKGGGENREAFGMPVGTK